MNPTDDFNSDDDQPDEEIRAQVEAVSTALKDFVERASSELGVYVTTEAALQRDPQSETWIVQTLVEFGERAYAKVKVEERNDEKFIEAVELDFIKDDLLRGLQEGEDDPS